MLGTWTKNTQQLDVLWDITKDKLFESCPNCIWLWGFLSFNEFEFFIWVLLTEECLFHVMLSTFHWNDEDEKQQPPKPHQGIFYIWVKEPKAVISALTAGIFKERGRSRRKRKQDQEKVLVHEHLSSQIFFYDSKCSKFKIKIEL